MPTFPEYLERILKARVYDVALETPLDPAPRLSARLGNQVLLKREDLQPVFSFKVRGAYNKLAEMSVAARSRGVICSSAGNHAQGVALAARSFGTRALIVMPSATARIKVEAVKALGGEVILHGEAYDDAYAHAITIAAEKNLTFVHPFDDPAVIAGQGTIAMEILRQHREPIDAIFVPIGGGGLVASIALYTKPLYPEIRIIGVQAEESPSMKRALEAGAPVTLERVGTFADGVAVRRVGNETFRICRELLDDVVICDTDEICAAIQDCFEDTRTLLEPSGALAVAGMKHWLEGSDLKDRTLIAINSGANVNFDRLGHIAERASLGEQREALLAVEIPEKPGSFLAFCQTLGRRTITEFNYRYSNAQRANIFVGVELRTGPSERAEIVASLERAAYPVIDMSYDEMTKLHLRHMVGGPATGIRDERIFRFEFPERPGGLIDFLRAVGTKWNVSLFHYRNHGSDFARVLAGLQIADNELAAFRSHIVELGYPCWDESENPGYRMFLS
jgi:threonine dehydratase